MRNPSNGWNPESNFHWQSPEPSTECTWNPESTAWNPESPRIQACFVFPYMGEIFNAGRCLFRFTRLRYCGKQHELLKDFKKLAVSCGTKREFCLEALLACICGRLGCKYISLTMWWQGTDCNNNKGWKIYILGDIPVGHGVSKHCKEI